MKLVANMTISLPPTEPGAARTEQTLNTTKDVPEGANILHVLHGFLAGLAQDLGTTPGATFRALAVTYEA
jgi:hypothetical protein